MPKPRNIDPSFWDDPDIATLKRDERLLLIGMISSCADDEGRLLADPGYLRKRVFGYDDDVSKQDVQDWRDNIVAKCRNVKIYTADGQNYIWFTNWQKHQSFRYVIPSKLPAPPQDSTTLVKITEYIPSVEEDCGNFPQSSVNSPSVGLSRVNVVLSSVEKESPRASAAAKAQETEAELEFEPPPKKYARKQRIPDDFTLTEGMIAWAKERGFDKLMDLEVATQEFHDYWRGRGETMVDWVATWRSRISQQVQYINRTKGQTNGTTGRKGLSGSNQQGSRRTAAETGIYEFGEGFDVVDTAKYSRSSA